MTFLFPALLFSNYGRVMLQSVKLCSVGDMHLSVRNSTLLVLALVFALGAALLHQYGIPLASPKDMADFLRSFGLWGPFVVIALMIAHSFVPFPAELLAICAGAVFGAIWGSVLIWVGAMFGALTAFALSRWLGQAIVRNWVSDDHAKSFDRWTDNHGALTLLVSRFIPVIAFNLINYAAGLTQVRTWTFIWTTALGILPVTVLSTYLGSRMRDLDWTLLLVVSAASIVIVLLFHTIAKRREWI